MADVYPRFEDSAVAPRRQLSRPLVQIERVSKSFGDKTALKMSASRFRSDKYAGCSGPMEPARQLCSGS